MTEIPIVNVSKHSQNRSKEEIRFTPDFSHSNTSFVEYRKKSWDEYKKIPFPTGKEEAWKRTSLRELNFDQLSLPSSTTIHDTKIPESLTLPLTDDLHGGQILLTSSSAEITLDKNLEEQGVIFTDLRHAEKSHGNAILEVIQKAPLQKESKFASLASAFGETGVFIYIPKGVKVEKPLHSLYWLTGEGLLNALQIFVYLDEDASVTYVHENSSSENISGQSVFTGNIHIYSGKGSKLNFVELQSFGRNVWNFSHESVNVDTDAEVDWVFGALGSHLTKNFSDLNLVGSGSSGKMSGFYFTNHDQHLDHDTQQNHLAPNSTSDLLFKGALLGESRSVWQGMIYVDPTAVKADGYQANRNLVLSKKARADSIPGLEILTDDVRCTHGATVGKIDPDQLFYLESRGMPQKTAEKLIVEGFFDPIMQRIPFAGVRDRFKNAIEEKMKEY